MILRPNRNKDGSLGSWKLRIYIDRGEKYVKREVELGLATRDYAEACQRAAVIIEGLIVAGLASMQQLSVCDAVHGRKFTIDDVAKLKRIKTSEDDAQQMIFPFFFDAISPLD